LCRRIDRPTQNSDTFGIIQAPNETTSDLQYRKICEHVPCTRRTSQENEFELILTVIMETRHRVEGYFGSEFRSICNHCGVMTD